MKHVSLALLMPFIISVIHAQTYITHVSVVDVINMKTNADETVVISNGQIVEVGKSNNIHPPANATIINGTGKYLMPGLVDAHVHFFQSGGLYTRPDFFDLRKYRSYDKEITWAHEHFEDLLR
ncbi:MAG TPA: hypothetical protein VEV62_06255, partial [Parafilimonas sp.]|nr:hypothetical protein [Parafilimonas sp.]